MWTFNKTDISQLDQFSDRVIRQQFGTELVITDLVREDSGEIGCEARSNQSVVVLTSRLVVTGQEEEEEEEKVKVVLGEAKLLPCQVTGEKAEISWYKDGDLVSSQAVLGDGSLVIKAVTVEDLGEYFCSAVNVRLGLHQQMYPIIYHFNSWRFINSNCQALLLMHLFSERREKKNLKELF